MAADTNVTRARKPKLDVYLEPEMHARLEAVCRELGEAKTTVAARAIRTYVIKLERELGIVQRDTKPEKGAKR